jgi:hypothetical protein
MSTSASTQTILTVVKDESTEVLTEGTCYDFDTKRVSTVK